MGLDPVLKALKNHDNLPKDFPGAWLVVTPVHWEATHNNAAIVAGGDALNLSDEASRKLYTAFAAFLAEDNMQLHYCDANTWLLLCEHQAPPQTEALEHVLQRSMHVLLDGLKSTPFWLRFITESQMFLSGQVQEGADYPINGVWVWPAAQPKRTWRHFWPFRPWSKKKT
ncbi:MAG: hypothetical protein P1U39_01870 [Legionellaceae bacterium]|nr:hypothetical protein [Legionellaceae bacterium]